MNCVKTADDKIHSNNCFLKKKGKKFHYTQFVFEYSIKNYIFLELSSSCCLKTLNSPFSSVFAEEATLENFVCFFSASVLVFHCLELMKISN